MGTLQPATSTGDKDPPYCNRGATETYLYQTLSLRSFMVRASFGVALVFFLTPVHADAGDRSPVVVELFTSEGCSSCPPADAALERLERSQPVPSAQIIPLSFHVDYWNHLGWADPYSSSDFSLRQEEYSEVFGGNRIYTPQMVVDGSREFVGDESWAVQYVAAASTRPKARIEMALSARCEISSDLKVSVGQLSTHSKADTTELFVAVTESGLVSQVTRGENAGRLLRHTAVVRQLRSLGEVKGTATKAFVASTQLSLDKTWKRSALRVVAFLQEKKGRHILGATVQPYCG
jgi:hypothetical protein